MIPRRFLAFACALTLAVAPSSRASEPAARPNVVFIIADDLGYGDLGCYGQEKIRTPNLDRLAREGMKLTQHYSGSNVCAPSRCALMSGLHPGHGYIRENRQAKGYDEGQEPVPAGTCRLPLRFQARGYVTGLFGKWGLGPVGSTGDPSKQGFDHWFGYNCQAVAHNYYPTHLWNDGKKVMLDNPAFSAHQKLPAGADPNDPKSYLQYKGKQFAPDLIAEQARAFVAANKDKPFILFYTSTIPHLALQPPQDMLDQYAGKFPETPHNGERGYLPHRQPHAAYAAMVSRLDAEAGWLMAALDEHRLTDRTLVVFVSDNGPLYDGLGGTDSDFFNSSAGLRGRKGNYYEGGFRVPCLVKWPGKVAAGSVSDRVTGFEDWLPTLFELTGDAASVPKDLDGISFAPTLLGGKQPPRPFLYRESPGYDGQQCVRVGDWKAIRRNLNPRPKSKDKTPGAVELYDLAHDPGEKSDLAPKNPEVVARLSAVMADQHTPSDQFPLRALDPPAKK